IVLALGVQRMIKRNAIVRHLPTVETLGAVDIICSDKTGTLTQNKMTLTHGYTSESLQSIDDFSLENDTTKRFVQAIALCNNATITDEEQTGDPTELALLEAGIKIGLHPEQVNSEYVRHDAISFDSEIKMMTTIHRNGDEIYLFVKDALERLLAKLTAIEVNGRAVPFTDENEQAILQQVDEMASKALRVLAVAYKKVDSTDFNIDQAEDGLTFLGLTGMIDPPREEVKDSVATCHDAGINVVMITGDHQQTALAIAKDLGIAEHEYETVTGQILD